MSTLKVNSIIPVAGVPTGGGGGITQIKQAVKTDTSSTTSTSFTDVSGLSVSMTATSSTNKFLIICNVAAACDFDSFLRLLKDSSEIGSGTGGSSENGFGVVRQAQTNQVVQYCITFLETAGDTSEHTFKVQFRASNSSNNIVINRRELDSALGVSSSITVMEVSA